MRLLPAIFIFALLFSGMPRAEAGPALDRVNKTNTLRCGYIEYSPALVRDMKTNTWSGFDYEIIKAVGERLELNVEYAATTGWGTVAADLNAGKFDAMCSLFWVHPNVGKFALFTRPAVFQPVFIISRANDARFNDKTNLNDSKLKMVALDGDNPFNIAKVDFPLAQTLALPTMTDFTQVLINVADGKADFTIADAATFGIYNKNNPGKLKISAPQHPIRVYPTGYVFGSGEEQLRDAFNAALDELILDGTIDRIFDQYDKYQNAYYRAVVPFKNPYTK